MADDRLSPSVDERLIERLDAPHPIQSKLIPEGHFPEYQPDEVILGMAGALKEAREKGNQLLDLKKRLSADKTLTPEDAALRLRTAATTASEAVVRKLDASRDRAAAALDAYERATGIPPAPANALAASMEAEIRAHLKEAGEQEREEIISQAFQNRDVAVLGAVLRAAPFLSGLTPTRLDGLRHRYRKEFHPHETAQSERRRKALDQFNVSGKAYIGFVTKLIDSPAAKVADASRRAREEAEAALQTLSGE